MPPYPTIPEAPLNTLLLNTLADKYNADTPLSQRSDPDFVFVYIPLVAFRALNDYESLIALQCTKDDLLGILYFSGYWGGIWLRDQLLVPPIGVPSNFLTPRVSANITDAVNAATGAQPLTYTRNQVVPAVASFGYNAGYFNTIYDNPPTGILPDPKWIIEYNDPTNVALTAKYETKQLKLSTEDRRWIKDLNKDSTFISLKLTCLQIQSSSYANGVTNWSPPSNLNVIGLSEANYNLLLKASSGFLEIAQYNALEITQSIGYESQILARMAAFTNGAFLDFNGAYAVGLLDSRYDTAYQFPSIQGV